MSALDKANEPNGNENENEDIDLPQITNDMTNSNTQSNANITDPDTNTTDQTTTPTINNNTSNQSKVTGIKRKREKTRWGPPPRKKRWGTKQTTPNTHSLISNLIKISHQKQTNTAIASAMFGNAWNENQTKIFLLKNQFQDVSTRLIAPGAFVATQSDAERSPSPEPIYDQKGVRINTREYRLREKLQKQRIKVIQQLIELDPNYQAPSDYKPPKLTHKIMMPVDDYPDYNFFGLIVGPRGNTQKEMQKATGCKIAVRGQGACLDKPGRLIHPDDNEPLHVHITAPNQAAMDKAIQAINNLLEEVKTGGGEHKAKQLRELATINGTLRIESRCRICGGQHPIYRCPEKTGEKWTPADVQCKICGELTHVTEDCKHYKRGKGLNQQPIIANSRQSIDAEYRSFMQELIGDGPMSSNRPIAAITAPPLQPRPHVGAMIGAMNVIMPQPQLHPQLNGVHVNGYHNVPPPSQNGAVPPTQYVANGGVNNEEKQAQVQVQIQAPMMPIMPAPMGMPMMYGMAGMGGMGGIGAMGMGLPMNGFIRPSYPMPINPYMNAVRPPIPFGVNINNMNPYAVPVYMPPQNPYANGNVPSIPPPPPPPPPANNGQ